MITKNKLTKLIEFSKLRKEKKNFRWKQKFYN